MFHASQGAVHRYMESSPGCWAAFGEVLAREYSDMAYARAHRLTVDSYAVQHPGRPSPQSIQSVSLHLISLCLVLEHHVSIQRATEVLQESAQYKRSFVWLDPPPVRGEVTVADVNVAENAARHVELVWTWAKSVWAAWAPHHDAIEAWLQRFDQLRDSTA
jgi:hypothetical protein